MFIVLLHIRGYVTWFWVHGAKWILIWISTYVCDNVFEYEVSTWVHEWPYEIVYDGECDVVLWEDRRY